MSGLSVEIGQGFSGHIAATGEPDILPDITQSHGVLNPLLRGNSQSLWGAPLKEADRVIGVLMIGFARPYVWLPTERELLRAIADRSALAINRAEMTDALRERETRIAELSGHLLKVQEEERKHISRELHDETGQALMVIRLYLGMLDQAVTTRVGQGKNPGVAGGRRSHHRGYPAHHRPAFAAGVAGAGVDCRHPQGSQGPDEELRRQRPGRGLGRCRPGGAGSRNGYLPRGAGIVAQRRQAFPSPASSPSK